MKQLYSNAKWKPFKEFEDIKTSTLDMQYLCPSHYVALDTVFK